MTLTRAYAMFRPAVTRTALFACATLGFAACKGDGPPVPTTFAPTGGSTIAMTGVVAAAVTTAPQVQILDAKGRGIKGLRVRWKVGTNSGGVVNDSTLTDNAGTATSGGWTLGTASGLQTLTASADGVSPVTFTAQVAPGPVANLVRQSQDGQTATVNTNVAVAPSVRAQDTFGNAVPGVAVTFVASVGGGSVDGAQKTTDQNGIATVNSWRMGTTAGSQEVRASATGASLAFFGATALPGPAADVVKAIGDNQTGVSGLAIGTSPGVKVVDAFGNGVGNVPVTFVPGPNSGSVINGTVTTDPSNGIAVVGSWILSTTPSQTLVASTSALPGKSLTFSASAIASNFKIEVRFVGSGGTAQVRQGFLDAAVRWQRVIVGHAHTTPLNVPAASCLGWEPAVNETINDLLIFARIGPIDQGGTGGRNIIGGATPCYIATSDRLTIMGSMEFDEYDLNAMLADGTFGDVVSHEMGHVLGIGTLWDANSGRSLLVGAGTAAPYFTGAAARAQFAAINTVTFSGNSVPVEGNSEPEGTRDSHWRKSVFGRELMQGYVERGGMPLSRVTVGAMQDVGYTVNLAAADPFTITSPILQGFAAFEPMFEKRIAHDVPAFKPRVVGRDGKPLR